MNTLTKAFTTNVEFPPMLRLRSVKTSHLYSEAAQRKLKTK